MANKSSVRWAFNISSWFPTESEILLSSTCIQPEEKSRIGRFVFQKDAKSSLIGRLMMRSYVHYATKIPYNDITFGRDCRGKPILLSDNNNVPNMSFNISHQGNFVVLAGETNLKVGIDVMKTEATPNKNVNEMFRLMKRQFSPIEWQAINSSRSDKDKLASFYRFWCLKESYVKNIGVGITLDLSSISFAVGKNLLSITPIIDTQLFICGNLLKGWLFEESLLDESHVVSVAIDFSKQMSDLSFYRPVQFNMLNFEEVVAGATALNSPDTNFTKSFFDKDEKPF